MLNTKSNTIVDHIVVNVSNLSESLNWYLSSFECEKIYQSKTLAILKFKNIKIVLSLPSEQRAHIAYIKENASEFGEIREQSDLCFSTFIADPTGNQIELVNKTCENHQLFCDVK